MLVAKEDDSIRVCVAYRKLNSVIFNDAYPLIRIYVCLDALSSAKWLDCIDLSSGFWQLSMTRIRRKRHFPQAKDCTNFEWCHMDCLQYQAVLKDLWKMC